MQLTWETIVTNINWTFVVNLVQFFVLIFILNRMIYKPLIRFIDQRDARLNAQLQQAEQQRAEAEVLKAKRESELREAGLQARKTLEAARREAAEIRMQLRAQAEVEGRQVIDTARQEAETQLKSVRQGLEKQIEHLAETAAAQVLG